MDTGKTKYTFIAAISDRQRMPRGMGILIDPDTVITCAHVVNEALGRDSYAAERPNDVIVDIYFPFSNDDRKGKIHDWLPPSSTWSLGHDICVLRLTAPAPGNLEVARFSSTITGGEFKACRRTGTASPLEWGYGEVRDLSEGGCCQVEAIPGKTFLKEGHSGSPALCRKSGSVLGMVARVNREAQVGHIISTERIGEISREVRVQIGKGERDLDNEKEGLRDNMEFARRNISTVEAILRWSNRNLELFFKVLWTPGAVLSQVDFRDSSSTIKAIQFAIFPIIISIAIEFPIYLLSKDITLGILGYFVAKLVAYAAFVLIYALSQRISAAIFYGRKEFNLCFITTLYATAFWPLAIMTNYLTVPLKDIMSPSAAARLDPTMLTNTQVLFLGVNTFVFVLLSIFFILKFVDMTIAAHGVGRIRAFIIVFSTIMIGTPATFLFLEPLSMPFYGHHYI